MTLRDSSSMASEDIDGRDLTPRLVALIRDAPHDVEARFRALLPRRQYDSSRPIVTPDCGKAFKVIHVRPRGGTTLDLYENDLEQVARHEGAPRRRVVTPDRDQIDDAARLSPGFSCEGYELPALHGLGAAAAATGGEPNRPSGHRCRPTGRQGSPSGRCERRSHLASVAERPTSLAGSLGSVWNYWASANCWAKPRDRAN
jgi:hypothetical protein